MTAASVMVVWFIVRMLGGGSYEVWRVSCLLGAWAPLASAAAFLYLQRVGDREDTVLAAWLVRAIGMHFVLAWMLGVSDWLRGPPGAVPALNADLAAPFVLASFFPAFALSFAALRWLVSVRRRLASSVPSPVRTVVLDADRVPYRGAGRVRVTEAVRAFPWALAASSAVGAVSVWLATAAPLSTPAVLGATAVALGVTSTLGAQAVAPSVVSLVCVALALVTRDLAAFSPGRAPLACAWPWVATAGLGVYLVTLEARLRLLPPPATASAPRP